MKRHIIAAMITVFVFVAPIPAWAEIKHNEWDKNEAAGFLRNICNIMHQRYPAVVSLACNFEVYHAFVEVDTTIQRKALIIIHAKDKGLFYSTDFTLEYRYDDDLLNRVKYMSEPEKLEFSKRIFWIYSSSFSGVNETTYDFMKWWLSREHERK